MPLNSVNTNIGAMVALQSLNRTNDEMSVTQKRISTGQRVADAKDDGAAFAVAQKVRGDIAGVTSANEQLGAAKGLLDTTLGGLNKISSTLATVKGVVDKLADDNVKGEDRTNYEKQYTKLRQQISQYVNDSSYNGASPLGKSNNTDVDGGTGGVSAASVNVVRNEKADTYAITSQTNADFDLTAATGSQTASDWKAMLTSTTTGDFGKVEKTVNAALNRYGNDSKAVDAQISFNKDRVDAMESGIGALVDADLAKESAKMQALQIRQQLGTQSLSIANQAPQSLLSLFR